MTTQDRLDVLEIELRQLQRKLVETERMIRHIVPTYYKKFFEGGKWKTKKMSREDLLKELQRT